MKELDHPISHTACTGRLKATRFRKSEYSPVNHCSKLVSKGTFIGPGCKHASFSMQSSTTRCGDSQALYMHRVGPTTWIGAVHSDAKDAALMHLEGCKFQMVVQGIWAAASGGSEKVIALQCCKEHKIGNQSSQDQCHGIMSSSSDIAISGWG